ncbi:hypothetical protein MRB53_009016 [Persea americana]|uniref:Uncharacterized protein n=1 Tax=Persea americana TaxID=3435 RepID=A0ACC2LMU5_PERAE|nr:hypothetical protein MRB53_009016 [Persea americana]|eukprot:TRINITY_DN34412_c0_g1_i1.p1 TRINITY_DN34412_c0_g1~~TRINITY_DN34412_c0_g1_i1.p1  ORF type:complete len:481 (+),score=81.43 TRINITY_DN34412_c0_g1_i1:189-1631(+)
MAEAAPLLPFMHSLIFVLLLFTTDTIVNCSQEKKQLDLLKFLHTEQQTHNQRCWPRKPRSENGVSMLEMKHHGFCSGTNRNWDDEYQKRLIADDLRVKSLQLRMKNAASGLLEDLSEAQIPLTSGKQLQILNYVVAVELGGKKMTVIVDTGSELTWVQCEPCKSCYTQEDPLFNPATSPSYRPILCNSSTCGTLEFATGNSGVCGTDGSACNYIVSYGDGSHTSGELGSDSLNFGGTVVKNFIFGCGQSNQGLFGGAAGLIGLGRSQLSLVAQTSWQFGGVFSYCLPSTEDYGASGSLILGDNSSVYRNTTPISFTRMVPNPQLPTLYSVNLTGISIGGVPLQASAFSSGSGLLIDSGTVITRLAPSTYTALRDEFLKQFSRYPSAPAFSILDTCFDLSKYKEANTPILKFHFEGGVEVNVDIAGVFYFVRRDQACLAIASLSSEDEIGIIGNYQQKNLRVVYDSKESRLGFGQETCSYV